MFSPVPAEWRITLILLAADKIVQFPCTAPLSCGIVHSRDLNPAWTWQSIPLVRSGHQSAQVDISSKKFPPFCAGAAVLCHSAGHSPEPRNSPKPPPASTVLRPSTTIGWHTIPQTNGSFTSVSFAGICPKSCYSRCANTFLRNNMALLSWI